MKNLKWLLLLVLLCLGASGSEGCNPVIIAYNKTNIGVKVAITPPGDRMQVVSPSPGSSSGVEVHNAGAFTAVAVRSQEWVEWATLSRKVLSDLLSNPQNLSPDQIKDIQKRLSEIETQLKTFESTTGPGAACTGTIEMESAIVPGEFFGLLFPFELYKNGAVDVTMSAGQLQITCQ